MLNKVPSKYVNEVLSVSWTRESIFRHDVLTFSLHINALWFLKGNSSIWGDNYMGNFIKEADFKKWVCGLMI